MQYLSRYTKIYNLSYVKSSKCFQEYYKFGLSNLHCWLRVLDYFLYIAYHLGFKKSASRTAKQKESVRKRKILVQQKLASSLNIKVDR